MLCSFESWKSLSIGAILLIRKGCGIAREQEQFVFYRDSFAKEEYCIRLEASRMPSISKHVTEIRICLFLKLLYRIHP